GKVSSPQSGRPRGASQQASAGVIGDAMRQRWFAAVPLVGLGLLLPYCGSDTPTAPAVPAPSAAPFVLTVPQLSSPAPGATISQSDPATGCPLSLSDGYGTQIDFAWTASQSSAGLAGYDLYVKGDGALYPIVDRRVTQTSYKYRDCNSHVVDA